MRGGSDVPDGVFNTAVAFSPEGTLVASYRKVFPWRCAEVVVARGGGPAPSGTPG